MKRMNPSGTSSLIWLGAIAAGAFALYEFLKKQCAAPATPDSWNAPTSFPCSLFASTPAVTAPPVQVGQPVQVTPPTQTQPVQTPVTTPVVTTTPVTTTPPPSSSPVTGTHSLTTDDIATQRAKLLAAAVSAGVAQPGAASANALLTASQWNYLYNQLYASSPSAVNWFLGDDGSAMSVDTYITTRQSKGFSGFDGIAHLSSNLIPAGLVHSGGSFSLPDFISGRRW